MKYMKHSIKKEGENTHVNIELEAQKRKNSTGNIGKSITIMFT